MIVNTGSSDSGNGNAVQHLTGIGNNDNTLGFLEVIDNPENVAVIIVSDPTMTIAAPPISGNEAAYYLWDVVNNKHVWKGRVDLALVVPDFNKAELTQGILETNISDLMFTGTYDVTIYMK